VGRRSAGRGSRTRREGSDGLQLASSPGRAEDSVLSHTTFVLGIDEARLTLGAIYEAKDWAEERDVSHPACGNDR
jgi:hypothetical protein